MMQLKRDSPSDLVEAIQALETRSDSCFEDLRLYPVPRGLASWATLVSLVLRTERERATEGYKDYDVKLINFSRWGTLILRWIHDHGVNSRSEVNRYAWTPSLDRAVDEALSVAAGYSVFLNTFPMWHNNRLMAELRPELVRFEVLGGVPARRVSAFQKGVRPASRPIPKTVHDEGLVLDIEQTRQRDRVLSQCFYSGHLKMAYPEPLDLYRLLLPPYLERLNAMFRRGDLVDLGPYTIGELKRAYAALTTIFSVHEDLCFRFGVAHEYPVNSCVMLRTPEEWSRLTSTVADLDYTKSSAIVRDLTQRDRFWDLHVQPFIQVDEGMLAAAPQFPLHSRADEKILRICCHVRRSYFDEASRVKEQEMLDDLLPGCPERFSPNPRISLPSGLPDIDLLLSDEYSLTVIVAELKWLRKPVNWRERIDQDAEFRKGLLQLLEIKSFLERNPHYLSGRGKLAHGLDYYQVAFLIVARDHFPWPDLPDCTVVEHEVFKEQLSRVDTLSELMGRLRAYEWLPIENADFVVRFDPAIANGVTIESEVFYRIS